MKKRTFFTTLALFLVFFNLGIFIVSSVMYKDMMSRAEDRSLSEHYFMVASLYKDFRAVESRELSLYDNIGTLLQPYSNLSADKEMSFALYHDNQLIYSKRAAEEVWTIETPQVGDRLMTTRRVDDHTYIIVAGTLPSPYHSHTLVYRYDISEGIKSWSQLKNILFLAGFILSILMAFGLLLVLNVVFKPLRQISQTSKNIANGAYETRLVVSGKDELAEMARSFNHMAEEIQRQMNELKDVADRKQQFVDNFAHELRTPLTAIYGYAEYMQRAVLSEDDRFNSLEYIMSESRRLQLIASQLLEMTNLKNNTQITHEDIDVAELLDNVKKTMYGRLQDKQIQIDFQCGIKTIKGDTSLLQSLIVNLVDNAISACNQGGHIVVSAIIEQGRKMLIVKDNGKGMSAEELSHITEPFYRGDKSRNRGDGGAGLGLAICNQIAVIHQANLHFTSIPGKGTTVKLTFTTSS